MSPKYSFYNTVVSSLFAPMPQVYGAEHASIADTLTNIANLHKVTWEQYGLSCNLFMALCVLLLLICNVVLSLVLNKLTPVSYLIYNVYDLAVILNLYHHHQGERNYADALKMYTVSLEMKRRLFGADHPSISDTLGNIALVHYKQGTCLSCHCKLCFVCAATYSLHECRRFGVIQFAAACISLLSC